MSRLPRSKPTCAVSTANVVVKMLCVGIIVGPLVDTLIVRMVQVPAATAGLGDVSWWTPKRWAVGTSLTAGRNGAHR
jgi:uncharacterized membrane protein YdfJ with MMPL/SSD domain